MKTKAKSASKKAKSPESKALNAKPRKTQKETPSKPAAPKPSVEVEESASDLENEFLEEEAHNALMENDSDDDDEELKGFESDSDTEENAKPLNLPPIPSTNRERKQAKKAAKAAAAEKSSLMSAKTPGTIYLGHIPHGFFEPQMHHYFSQFGTVSRLRLARNRRTGKSKHFAFIEFVSRDVAEVVAETMDGYLIPPHRLVCKVVEEVDEKVWKGANSMFKRVPWARINRERLERKKSRGKWEELVRKDEERKVKRTEKIKAMGIEYEFPLRREKRKSVGEAAENNAVVSKKIKTEKRGRKASGKKASE